jgi:hypothetical protein
MGGSEEEISLDFLLRRELGRGNQRLRALRMLRMYVARGVEWDHLRDLSWLHVSLVFGKAIDFDCCEDVRLPFFEV